MRDHEKRMRLSEAGLRPERGGTAMTAAMTNGSILALGATALWAVGTVGLGAAARAADVVVVEGDYLAKRNGGEARSVRQFMETVTSALSAAGIEYDASRDSAVEGEGALEGHKLAIFPHNSGMSPGEIEAIERFVERGGKIVLFYGLPQRLAALLGIESTGYVGGEQGRRLFRTVRFTDSPVRGLPPQMEQGSWNITSFEPLPGGAEVIGTWIDADGNDTGYAAVSMNPNGAMMNHVLTGTDAGAKARFILAVVGHFLPDVWPTAARRALLVSETIGRFDSIGDLTAFCESRGRLDALQPALEQAQALRAEARDLLDKQLYPEAIAKATEAKQALEEGYPRLYPPREGEMRAMWIHSPFNVDDWEQTCRHLRDCGFNAVIVNLCNAGIAYYPSQYLKTEDRAAQQGDQILRVLESCRRYGIELHVWRVNWRVSRNPERVRQIQDEGICGMSHTGEKGEWLCPSWPQNRQHEVDTMLEIVRNYDVDGIHFDYIRYANSNYCYCDHCRETFENLIGKNVEKWPQDVREGPLQEPYLQFRRDCITSVVREVSHRTRALKPWMKISAAVFGNWPSSRVSIGQDARLWVDKGYLDFVCPMNYTNDTERFGELVQAQVDAVAGKIPLYPGIGVWRHPSAATFVDQIALARELGADGFVGFCYETSSVQKYLTATGRSVTRGQTYMPHWAPKAAFRLPGGINTEHPRTYPLGRTVTVQVRLSTQSTLPQPLQRAWADLELRDTRGNVLADLGRLAADESAAVSEVSFEVPPGRSRLVLDGRMELADGSSRRFVKRSAVIVGLSEEGIRELKGIEEPPKIAAAGLKVGVTADGYGRAAIIEALADMPGVAPFELRRLSADFLNVCDVLVLAQLREPSALTDAVARGIERWVRGGGRILLTHDAVGYRQHPVIFPEVCSGEGIGSSRRITVVADHPVTAGLQTGDSFEHSYYDHIQLRAGGNTLVLARDPQEDGGKAVVVAARSGTGKIVASGLITGLADGDREVVPRGGELTLLQSAIRWLGE